jgi:hypothetical protein
MEISIPHTGADWLRPRLSMHSYEAMHLAQIIYLFNCIAVRESAVRESTITGMQICAFLRVVIGIDSEVALSLQYGVLEHKHQLKSCKIPLKNDPYPLRSKQMVW